MERLKNKKKKKNKERERVRTSEECPTVKRRGMTTHLVFCQSSRELVSFRFVSREKRMEGEGKRDSGSPLLFAHFVLEE